MGVLSPCCVCVLPRWRVSLFLSTLVLGVMDGLDLAGRERQGVFCLLHRELTSVSPAVF